MNLKNKFIVNAKNILIFIVLTNLHILLSNPKLSYNSSTENKEFLRPDKSFDNKSIEEILADIPLRSYRNITNSEAKEILKKINKNQQISMPKESWEDIVISSRSKFEKNEDWYLIVKTLFEKSINDLQSRRDFLHTLEKLETKNRDAANELRDYLRSAKLIDIVK